MYNKEIGYTQSMNYVMGFILMVSGGNEEETFWFFVALAEGNDAHFHPGIEQFYAEGFPLYHQYVEHFESIFEDQLPKVKSHFEDLDYLGPIWLQKWLITLFLYSFPMAYCVRIWDNVLVEGPIFIFKTIIAVISGLETKLLKGDFERVNKIMCEINTGDRRLTIKGKSDILPRIEELIEKAHSISITLPDLTSTSISPPQ